MSSTKYTFYQLCNKEPVGLNNKTIQEHLLKWSMKKCLHIHYYAFNQEFMSDDIDQFALDFFRNSKVAEALQTCFNEFVGNNVAKVQTEKIPCNITSMTFFDKLLDPNSNIVCHGNDKDGNHPIRQCEEVFKNDESEEYYLYNKDERAEFIFRLLQHFLIGGLWCQDDDIIEPYLNATKFVYKDLLTVEKTPDSEIQVTSRIYKVIAFDSNGTVLFPKDIKKSVPYSYAYLAVNPKTRTIAFFFHNIGDTIYT